MIGNLLKYYGTLYPMTPLTIFDWRTTADSSEQHRIIYCGLCLAKLRAIFPVVVRQMNKSTLLSRAIYVAVEQSMSVTPTLLPCALDASLATLKACSWSNTYSASAMALESSPVVSTALVPILVSWDKMKASAPSSTDYEMSWVSCLASWTIPSIYDSSTWLWRKTGTEARLAV